MSLVHVCQFVKLWLALVFLRYVTQVKSDVNSPQTQGRHLRGSEDLNVEIRS